MVRPLNKIAAAILTDWGPAATDVSKQTSYMRHGLPYVWAMLNLSKITDYYGLDDGEDIVLRFLNNAASWRGETARALKAELNAHLKEKHDN